MCQTFIEILYSNSYTLLFDLLFMLLVHSYLLLVVQYDGAGLLHHLKHHDAAQVPPHRHGHVGESRQLVHELQQLFYFGTKREIEKKRKRVKRGEKVNTY